MFFGRDDFDVNIISVHKPFPLSLDEDVKNRDMHGLSIRVTNEAFFSWDGGSMLSEKGDITLFPAKVDHHIKSGVQTEYLIYFTTDKPLPGAIRKITPKNPSFYEKLFSDIYSVWFLKEPGYIFENKALFYKLVYLIEQEYESSISSSAAPRINTALNYILEHYTENIEIFHLAKLCSMSEAYFRKLFMKKYGVSPLKYINNLRLSYAKNLLSTGHFTVEQVSEMCGFNNVSYFSLFIKKETGTAPSKLYK